MTANYDMGLNGSVNEIPVIWIGNSMPFPYRRVNFLFFIKVIC